MKKLHLICGKCGSDAIRPGTFLYSKYMEIPESLKKVEDHVLSQVFLICEQCKNLVFLNEIKND